MPKSPVTDAQHVVYTDHSILRRPRAVAPVDRSAPDLVPFAGFTSSERDLGLAYAIAAPRERNGDYRSRALSMLQKAERASPGDTEVLLYLAELYRNGGQADLAVPLYRRAIQLDPAQVTASVGLGGILIERGQFADGIPLWEDALAKNSGLELVRTNLAMAYWRTGDTAAAEKHLAKALQLSPAFTPAADLLKRLREQTGRQ
jgi:tetratricopeptide (TPR) repeat protein